VSYLGVSALGETPIPRYPSVKELRRWAVTPVGGGPAELQKPPIGWNG